RVPEGHDAQRHEPAPRLPGPLLDHPVVVGPDAGQRQVVVLALGEHLPAEARVGREAQRRFDVVGVHISEAGADVVATGAHLVEPDRAHPPLGLVVAGGRVEHLVAPRQVLVHPPVGLRPVASFAEHLVAVDPVDAVRVAHDPRAGVAQGGRQPPLPDVRRFDHVVVDRDDPRDRGGHVHTVRAQQRKSTAGGSVRPMRVISADCHVNEPPWVFDRVPASLRDRAPRMLRGADGGDGWSFEGILPGNYDGAAHAKDMDADGVDVSVVYPNQAAFIYLEPDRELALACLRAYNDWVLEDFQGAAPTRIVGLPMLPVDDGMDVCVGELERTVAKGAKGMFVPGYPVAPYHDRSYDPLWAAAADAGV